MADCSTPVEREQRMLFRPLLFWLFSQPACAYFGIDVADWRQEEAVNSQQDLAELPSATSYVQVRNQGRLVTVSHLEESFLSSVLGGPQLISRIE